MIFADSYIDSRLESSNCTHHHLLISNIDGFSSRSLGFRSPNPGIPVNPACSGSHRYMASDLAQTHKACACLQAIYLREGLASCKSQLDDWNLGMPKRLKVTSQCDQSAVYVESILPQSHMIHSLWTLHTAIHTCLPAALLHSIQIFGQAWTAELADENDMRFFKLRPLMCMQMRLK